MVHSFGSPVDALDTVCKAYKDCLKCARMNHGNQCESVILSSPLYNYEITNDEAVCKDPAGSCGRAICECDAKFAREHVGHIGVFDEKYQTIQRNTSSISRREDWFYINIKYILSINSMVFIH